MKWYWIALIVVVAIVVGVLIYRATKKPSASSPATTTTSVTKVASNGKTDVITKENPDGSKVVAIEKVAA